MAASLTTWYRLEPSSGSANADGGVTPPATVRDPLWMLTRQWQLGEFLAADAGSLAWAEIATAATPLSSWSSNAPGAAPSPTPIALDKPLDEQVLREPFSPDLSVSIELGLLFEEKLTDQGAADLIPNFRSAFPLATLTQAQSSPNAKRLARISASRCTDGAALLAAAPPGSLPAQAKISGSKSSAAQKAIDAVRAWATAVYGAFGDDGPATWSQDKLGYSVAATSGQIKLAAEPSRTGDLEWFAFDQLPGPRASVAPGPASRVVPSQVRFAGMSSAGYWEFERTSEDLGNLEANKSDLGRLAFLDFLLVHNLGWYILPVDVPIGSIATVGSLKVVDVFGTNTLVKQADQSREPRCRLFVNSVRGDDKRDSGFLVVAPTPGAALMFGKPLEEVRLVRDDLAGMAWAIEESTQDGAGEPWLGRQRESAIRSARPKSAAEKAAADFRAKQQAMVTPTRVPPNKPGAVRYTLMTEPPLHWYPLLPVPVGDNGLADLELAALLDGPPGAQTSIDPAGRLLPSEPQFPSEHLAREGLCLKRVPMMARWTDGSRHMWIARQRTLGGGPASSGLKFDTIAPAPDIVVVED